MLYGVKQACQTVDMNLATEPGFNWSGSLEADCHWFSTIIHGLVFG